MVKTQLMKNLSFVLILIGISLNSNAQDKPSTIYQAKNPIKDFDFVCDGHYNMPPQSYDEPNVGVKTALINLQAYTQSIHNVIAKWDFGSVYSYSFGITPGGQELYNEQALSTSAKYTHGRSFKQLQDYGAGLGVTFNLGDDFYINLFSAPGVMDTAILLQFNWEDLGNSTNELTIEIETNYGVNGAGPFTSADSIKMMEFYTLVNPIIKQIYGPPSRNHVVTIVNDAYSTGSNTFYNGPNQISSSLNLNADGDLDQPRLMIHELVHAYRDNVVLSSDSLWQYDPELSGFEEGMAESVALIVMDHFIEQYPNFFNGDEFNIHWNQPRGMDFEWDYDYQNHPQISTENFMSSGEATGNHWVRYGIGAASMKKMYHEDNDIFKKFNVAYYSELNNDHSLLTSRPLILSIFNQIIPTVERTPVIDWINDQRIFDCQTVLGKKVFMLSFSSSNWNSFQHDNRIFLLDTRENGLEWYWNTADVLGANEITSGPGANWRWYSQYNNTNGNINFIRDWDNTTYGALPILTDDHWVTDIGGPYAGQSLIGPNQGPNPYYVGAVYTADHEQDDCSDVPGCGKRPWALSEQKLYTTTPDNLTMSPMLVSQGGSLLDERVELDMHQTGLFRYEIDLTDPIGPVVSEVYFRLQGDDFINIKGVFGGIFSNGQNLIEGRLFIEHEGFGPEPEITIQNNSFNSSRTWAGIVESNPNWQGGISDRGYSTPGKTHAIYTNLDCTEKKIDFRTIGYGDARFGNQMFLFNKDDFENIVFTESNDTTVNIGDSFNLKLNNNFSDIFDNDSRIIYTWINPLGDTISTNQNAIVNNALYSDAGDYTIDLSFFGCPVAQYSIKVSIPYTAEINTNSDNENIFEVFPSPATNKLSIKLKSVEFKELYITNNLGQKLSLNHEDKGNEVVFDVTKLAAGIYHVILEQEGQIKSKKVVIEK
ncbi:MAG: T9SS type A sorting domain-containing protein [Bacteroidetes bacterium]|nr:T9SS type A sorting domain-containing protein [Bacteroidota bacterium]